MVQVFGTALRTVYAPSTPYQGTLRLVLADDPFLDAEQNRVEHGIKTAGWRALAPELQLWRGPGDHFTMLRVPHVQRLARWWTQSVDVKPKSMVGSALQLR